MRTLLFLLLSGFCGYCTATGFLQAGKYLERSEIRRALLWAGLGITGYTGALVLLIV